MSASHNEKWPLYNATEENFFRISTDVPEVVPVSPTQHCGFLAAQLFNVTHFQEETDPRATKE